MTLEQVAAYFGVHPMTLNKWLRRAATTDGTREGVSLHKSPQLHDAKRPIRLLEQENEVLRRAAAYLSQPNLPGKGSTRPWGRAGDGVPVVVTCRVRGLARQPYYRRLHDPVIDAEITAAYGLMPCSMRIEMTRSSVTGSFADEACDVGEAMADGTAWRICRDHRLWSTFGKKAQRQGPGTAGP